MSLADLDQDLLITPPVKPKGLENLPILYPLQQTSPQKRGQHEVAHDMQGGKAKKTTTGTNTPTSYAGVVKASNQKLTITRKESQGDGGMDNMDLREIHGWI